ncbi:peptidase M23 [Shewanella sp. 10N.286.52.C2]|uniref:peptidoglycan DD-metalloendopeptidase family protein n=1 Tax=unclassified Shewanella TaxID=196818 RepID=UPI000C838F60|nr:MULTISPECIES: peptidoglycan DD-metalloendopeptidase family protein [unclassified Shewanella]MDO6638801.1 peptidoglycan DD-metalloendopeptidase family protein [Shewanella sp. 5_MG-2023]MDO6677156.1 peptidoglycan DD-metalloendopeptidase family protein [Shewanella sp. 4_MG-2023]MDO6773819.1 peptidoglycan DD-metalloendopeptidase family protein [Shewanella sp. 3_MG-2023]PMG31384.1 peptidase M23 [Shewanella sp. 10N.286.52.C2]PMI02964.1 peptidase M23 [Shewanella sp. 10N.286.48.A6]
MAKFITLFKLLPKVHQIALCSLVILTIVIVLFPSDNAQASKQANTGTVDISDRIGIQAPSSEEGHVSNNDKQSQYSVPLAFRTPTPPGGSAPANTITASNNDAQLRPSQESNPIADLNPLMTASDGLLATQADVENAVPYREADLLSHKTFKVAKGDTFGGLANRAGLSPKDVYQITRLPVSKKNLLKIMPGEEIIVSKDAQDEVTQISYQMDKVSTLLISKFDDKFEEKVNVKSITLETKFITANISTNFWSAAASAGLSANHIMQLANIFGWDIDFALDIRKDDHFSLMFEEEFVDGQFIGTGNILAAEFVNQGERYTAVRYTDGEYYSETGSSMRKAFLRSPVDFKYVSSSFNPRRLHPVTGQVRAHRGVDYVAAIGTPIKAAGRGKVIESSYNKYNGNYVFIKHNDTYTTKYLHLTKRKVKRGETVKQGQIIGTLGKTGRVTGAHLHYEFIVNGVHRNPRTIKLPQSKPIDKKEKAQFDILSKQIMAKIEQNKQQHYASN